MAYMPTRSFGIVAALMLAILFGPVSARANAMFTFAVSGEFDQTNYGGPDVFYPWTGHLTVVLDSGADGTYDNSGLVSFDMISTGVTFVQPAFDPIPFIAYFTVAGGKLTSISAVYYDVAVPDVVTRFDGLTVRYDQPQIYFTPATTGTAVLTPVPEPGAGAMLLLGLVLAVMARGIFRRGHAPAIGLDQDLGRE